MNVNDVKINGDYRFTQGAYKGHPCRVIGITRDDDDGRHDVRYKFTAGVYAGEVHIVPALGFASKVREE